MYRVICAAVLVFAGIAMGTFATRSTTSVETKRPTRNPDVPELRASNHVLSLELHAGVTAEGKDAFFFNGQPVAPTLRLASGDQLKITYVNDLPVKAKESCAISPCMDMTNLHFHGLEVSPDAPQDDVISMMAKPGESLSYTVQIPADHPPGLYWYHTHPHGESHRQVLDGMSGAIVIEGMEQYVPTVAGLLERILVLRGRSLEADTHANEVRQKVAIEGGSSCGANKDAANELMTLNGTLRPQIAIAPGERQFWRVVNASADRYADLQLAGQQFDVVAMDGMPIAAHDPGHPTRDLNHVLLPPAGRMEAIVTGPPAASATPHFISRCVDTGPDGDPNPAMVLADILPGSNPQTPARTSASKDGQKTIVKKLDVAALENTPPQFTVVFTEDKNGFYINGAKYEPEAAPMVRTKVGTLQHWRVINDSRELHPMHIHQVHFLAYAENEKPIANPLWLDTVNVSAGGSVDVVMDFTDPVIKGMSVFHCHLLNHEDKGMMAKILFE